MAAVVPRGAVCDGSWARSPSHACPPCGAHPARSVPDTPRPRWTRTCWAHAAVFTLAHACGVREHVAHTNTRVLRLALPSLTCDFPRPSPLDRDTVPCVSGYTSKHVLRHVLSLPRNVWLRVANGKVEQGVKWHLRLR